MFFFFFFSYQGLLICGVIKGYLISGVTCFCLGTREILSEATSKSLYITTIMHFFPLILLSVAFTFQAERTGPISDIYSQSNGGKNRRKTCPMKLWLHVSVSFSFHLQTIHMSMPEVKCGVYVLSPHRKGQQIIEGNNTKKKNPFTVQGHVDCFHISIMDNCSM